MVHFSIIAVKIFVSCKKNARKNILQPMAMQKIHFMSEEKIRQFPFYIYGASTEET
jgi:hypothetical protein